MSVINTNVTSLIAQKNLGASQSSLTTAMERLSSGMRINSAKDDAAGQAIANRMSAQITGLSQAQRNANDGISVAQTAEGALNQVNDNLQRIRELSVQSQNGTNSSDDLGSIQDEINQRLEEIDRISKETNFNGVKVLASDQGIKIQVGANDGEAITVDLKEINSSTLGLSKLDVTNTLSSNSLTAAGTTKSAATAATTVELTYQKSAAAISLTVGDDGKLYATDGTDLYDATFDSATNTVSYDTTTATSSGAAAAAGATTFVDDNGDLVELTTAQAAEVDDQTPATTYSVHQDAAGNLFASDGTDTWTMGANGNSIDLATGVVTIGTKDVAAATSAAEVTNGNVLTLPGTAAVDYDMTAVNAAKTGTNTLMKGEDGAHYVKNVDGDKTTYFKATVAADGAVTAGDEVVVDPLKSIDDALKTVDNLRSSLGAVQNRFESAITNLKTNETNLSAARSRIEDADYAVEVANMTKAQILQQAGTSVLAQANQIPQGVLSLLG